MEHIPQPTHETAPEIDITDETTSFEWKPVGNPETTSRFLFRFHLKNTQEYIFEVDHAHDDDDLSYYAGHLISGNNPYPVDRYTTFAHIVLRSNGNQTTVERLIIIPHSLH